jgi:hypothetical protein
VFALEFRTRKFALSLVNEKAVVSTKEHIDRGSLFVSVIIGLDNDILPVYYNICTNSNTADDFAMFISLIVAYEFLKCGDILVYDNIVVHFG